MLILKNKACQEGRDINMPTADSCWYVPETNTIGKQPWIFIGRTNAEAEAKILWPSDAKSWLTGKDPDDGKTKGDSEG